MFRRAPTSALSGDHHGGPHRPPPAPPTAAVSAAASREPFPLAEGYYGTVRTSEGGVSQHKHVDSALLDRGNDGSPAMGSEGDGEATRRHGRGLMVYPDRTIYEGDWVDDERHGSGICLFPSGNVYIGEFQRGHMEGRGSMLYHDGDFFTGSFYRSTCHGVGAFYSGGTEVRGEWRNGVRVAVQRRRQTSFEDFDAQRLHYETFSAVLRQLHNHFSFYALFDNRFMVAADGPTPSNGTVAGSPHIAEPAHPNRAADGGGGGAATASPSNNKKHPAAMMRTGASPLIHGDRGGGAERRITISPPETLMTTAGTDVTAAPQRQDVSSLVLAADANNNNSWGDAHQPGGSSFAASSDEEPVFPPLVAMAVPRGARASLRMHPSSPMNSSSALLSPVGATASGKISFSTAAGSGNNNKHHHTTNKHRGHRVGSIDVTSSPSKLPTDTTQGIAQAPASGGGHAGGPTASPPLPSMSVNVFHHGSSAASVGGAGFASATATQPVVANDVATHPTPVGQHSSLTAPPPRTQSHCSVFPSAGPMVNEHFSMHEYMRHVVLFMFPLLSIPHIQSCPLTITGLEMEREFVVSGAALSHDFTPPKGTVYLAIIGLLVHVTAVVMASSRTGVTSVMGHAVLSVEVIGPGVLWVVFAFTCAGYHGFFRVAHALERLDRRLAPKLAAFAANVVDASADICVFTWDEEGRSKITNAHYKYRWMCASIVIGGCAAFAAPLTRVAYGIDGFLSDDPFQSAVVGLTVVSMFVFATGLTYYTLKVTDMQRQVRSQLKVLTKLACLDGVAITAPSEHRTIKFDLDGPLDVNEFFTGFVGWWITRSFVLGASACSNHLARAASMSAFVVAQTTLCVVVMGDAVFAGATGQLHSDEVDKRRYFTGAHSLALVFVTCGGFLMCRYLAACVATRHEMKQHLNIMDVAALYHSAMRRDLEASHVIQLCRNMIKTHDPVPTVASIEITPFVVLLLTSINVMAFGVLWVIFADAF